nr:hypothetical protein GCM10017745_01730 [Saccharothrix mutabilis subsp. capreolus]
MFSAELNAPVQNCGFPGWVRVSRTQADFTLPAGVASPGETRKWPDNPLSGDRLPTPSTRTAAPNRLTPPPPIPVRAPARAAPSHRRRPNHAPALPRGLVVGLLPPPGLPRRAGSGGAGSGHAGPVPPGLASPRWVGRRWGGPGRAGPAAPATPRWVGRRWGGPGRAGPAGSDLAALGRAAPGRSRRACHAALGRATPGRSRRAALGQAGRRRVAPGGAESAGSRRAGPRRVAPGGAEASRAESCRAEARRVRPGRDGAEHPVLRPGPRLTCAAPAPVLPRSSLHGTREAGFGAQNDNSHDRVKA